jgi:S-(hydroxymethyl)glutathione dehydrogenase/alcohol dehydrogenase
MRAAVLHTINEPMSIETLSLKRPGPREVIVRTVASGLCHSDLHYMEGLYPTPLPIVMGHESAGIVESVGEDVRYVTPGDHVVVCTSMFCGTCDHCVTGRPFICSSPEVKKPPGASEPYKDWRGGKLAQFVNLGAFAEQMLVHENAVVKIDRDMPLDLAALTGCAIVTGYGSIVHAGRVRPGESVVVIGCGGVGLAAVATARNVGAGRIIAVDINPAKREVALGLGATDVVDPTVHDPVEQVRELTRGGTDHAFEMLGLKTTAEQAFAMLGPGGTATVAGMIPFGTKIELHGADLLRSRRLQGTAMGSNQFRVDIPNIVAMHMQGRLPLDRWLTGRVSLGKINEGFADLKAGRTIRTVVEFPL